MSRKVTDQTVSAFLARRAKKVGNTRTDGTALFLHGNKIAEFRDGVLWITNAGWSSNTTKERLNGLPGVHISQKNFQWFLRDQPWDGSWIKIGTKEAADQYDRNLLAKRSAALDEKAEEGDESEVSCRGYQLL